MRNAARPIILSLLLAAPLPAQYFGRNKVRYEEFGFQVMKSKQFVVHFYPAESTAVVDATRMLERWHTRLTQVFEVTIDKEQPVILYANHADFQQTNAVSGFIPEGTGGVTEGLMNRIIVPLAGAYAETDHVLGHELAHAFHYATFRKEGTGLSSAAQIPLWFVEGMSEYLSIGSRAPLTAMWMRDAVLSDDVPGIMKVSRDPKYFPYRYGHALWAYIGGTYGDMVISNLFGAVLQHGWHQGFRAVFGTSVDSVSMEWVKTMRRTYSPAVETRTAPDKLGSRLLTKADVNLAPIVSPDGRYVAFFSTRDLFTIDLFLAEATTGKIVKKLVSSEAGEHFDALPFLNSTGTWSPDGRNFAFPVLRKGKDEIAVLDVNSRKVTGTHRLDGVSTITQLAWSPDGRKILLSGMEGGLSDLYLYDLQTGKVEQLTSDRYADMQPSWSPDGKSIVFVTDRGPETDFDSLRYAPMRIGLYRTDTRTISLISIADWAKHVSPQFAPDGGSIYFVSDPDGVSDIYRYSLDSGVFFRVTRIATGVTGLTELSPTLSVASKCGRLVFSAFDRTNYFVQSLEPAQSRGTVFTPDRGEYLANVVLPPADSLGSIVDKYLNDSRPGLPSEESFLVENYHPRLGLLYIGQIFAGVTASQYGVGLGGGATFLFSDLLGDHLLGLSGRVSGSVTDVAGEMFYINRERRLNWGLVLSHVPYLSTRIQSRGDSVVVDSQSVPVQRITITDLREFEDRISMIAELPLTANRRFEVTAGYTHVGYDYRSEVFRVTDNTIVDQREEVVHNPSSLNLFQAALAFVGDYSYSGLTGPVKGRRYRLELEPTGGSLFFMGALADFRQYFFVRPVSLAYRLLHYGRYLQDSESDRLSPLFLGYETWVRGYSIYTYDLSACADGDGFEECPEFDRLTGSKVGVLNAELRMPLLGTPQFGLVSFPYLPTDLVGFFDAGVAWNDYDPPELRIRTESSDRVPVFSAGGALRMALFGVVYLQLYYAYPFQRTDRDGHWGLVLAPGW